MKRINLIPPEFATGRKALVETGLQKQAIVVGIVILSVLVVHYGISSVNLSTLKKKVKTLNQDFNQANESSEAMKKSTGAVSNQLDNLEERMVLLGEKRSQLLKLKGERFKWSDALSQFHEAIPNKVWVDELLLARDESQVRGGTFGNEWISKFIDNLNGSHYFKNAAFARTEAGKLNDRSVVNFELVFELVQQSG